MVLTRYACYLIAINGATSKPEIAFAQKYFVTKARSYEVLEQKIEEHLFILIENIYEIIVKDYD